MSNITYDLKNLSDDLANLIYITKAKYENDWGSLLHFHNFTEILFVLEGEGHIILNDSKMPVNRGKMVIINPNCIHTESSTALNPLSYIILGIDNISFEGIEANSTHLPTFDFNDDFNFTKNLLTFMMDEISSQQENFRQMLTHLLGCFLIFLKRKTALYTKSFRKVYASKESLFVKQYIDSHYSQDITLTELSSKAMICKNHLMRSFKKYFSVTPIEYLISVRLNEGRILLERTEMSISDIASSIGFTSPSRFSQRFSALNGMSPSQYRINFLNSN